MRMWMQKPSKLCRQHLLGEHNELHAIVGILDREYQINGYIKNNLIEPKAIKARHEEIVSEMINRGYQHNSPLVDPDINYLPKDVQNYRINREAAKQDLLTRCEKCLARFEVGG